MRKVCTSNLFAGDAKLNNALNEHPHHILEVQSGDHVGKIHDALAILQPEAVINFTNEIRTKTYGTTTGDAVLAYKTDREIINKSYQSTPDRIVGIMTMERLDKDMREKEADFPRMITAARLGAMQRCFVAHQRIVGFSQFEPRRIDPNEVFKRRALESARNIFDDDSLELEDMDGDAPIAITIGKMKNILSNSALPTVNVTSADPGARDGRHSSTAACRPST